eukprot:3891719-Prymnesium_polylepis.1
MSALTTTSSALLTPPRPVTGASVAITRRSKRPAHASSAAFSRVLWYGPHVFSTSSISPLGRLGGCAPSQELSCPPIGSGAGCAPAKRRSQASTTVAQSKARRAQATMRPRCALKSSAGLNAAFTTDCRHAASQPSSC